MALLGSNGILEISREWPDPIASDSSKLNTSSSNKTFTLSDNGYWTGDHIFMSANRGVPFDLNGDGYADCPDGHGVYAGSKWNKGPSKVLVQSEQSNYFLIEHLALGNQAVAYSSSPITITVQNPSFKNGDRVILTCPQGLPIDTNNDGYADTPDGHSFYVRSDGSSAWILAPSRAFYTGSATLTRPFYNTANNFHPFYTKTTDTGFTNQLVVYIRKDSTNKVRFFNGPSSTAAEYALLRVKTGTIVLSKYKDTPTYAATLLTLASNPKLLSLTGSETILEETINLPSVLSTPFYNTNATTGYSSIINGYARVDDLDRVRLFSSEISALNADSSSQLEQLAVDCGNFIVARYSNNNDYQATVIDAANSIKSTTIKAGQTKLKSLYTIPPTFYLAPAERGWLFQAQISEWAVDVDAANLDMTAIGETFGDHVKALVRGAGTMQFLLEHNETARGQSSLTLLHLVLLTQQGSQATAKFYLQKDRAQSSTCPQIGGSVYYDCSIILTNTKISTRADAIITGSCDFVIKNNFDIRVSLP